MRRRQSRFAGTRLFQRPAKLYTPAIALMETMMASHTHAGLSRPLLLLYAAASGCAVANLYYIQPLLPQMAQAFHCGLGQIGAIATALQLAYAAGLLLLLPLADAVDKKGFLTWLWISNGAGSILAALADSWSVLMLANLAIGPSAISAQLLIPLVSQQALPEQRGRAVGVVLSGMLSGILLSRVASGLIAAHGGWQAAYWLAAALDGALLLLVRPRLPRSQTAAAAPYPQLLASLWRLWLSHPLLRASVLCGAASFAAVSALWAALAWLLAQPPYHYASAQVGALGLVGIAGILATPYLGRLADLRGSRHLVALGAGLSLAAFLLLLMGAKLPALLLALILLDIGGRAALLGNQLRALALDESARARLNTLFMSCYFLGGAFGTRLGSSLAPQYGWGGIAAIGVAGALIAWAINRRLPGPAMRPAPAGTH
ncbi:MFS transporter [Chromobacterium sp. IIBBL 290-4]|uniref:MFS transporter n=1 Tax=Chromobacterium sp. IIBBL 290-4 TaxID=2953890 RepID=UPI0020B6E26B|nr:MFS transporter [Chromobacterium sp. IIBBL 290-4]UTH75610.1 MFS transporter [Chromobacterium sp. IIBBL 290-4]